MAIEVGNDKIDVVLGKLIETGTFRKNLPEIEVIIFNVRFFPGRVRIAVIDSGSAFLGCRAELKCRRIGELGTVVGEDDGEHLSEGIEAKCQLKRVEHFDYGSCIVGWTQESKHEAAGVEVHREECFLAWDTDDAVHFDHRNIWIGTTESLKVAVGTSDATLRVDFVFNGLALAFLPAAGHRQVMSLRANRPALNQVVNGFLADRENILIGIHDVVDGLPFPCTVIHHVADLVELIFRHVDAFARFFERLSVAFLRDSGYIIIFRQRTLPLMPTSVANIRRIDQPRTFLRGKHAAQFVA